MKRKWFVAAMALPLLASCSSATLKPSDRETLLDVLNDAKTAVLSEQDNPFGTFSFRARSVEEDESEILLFGIDEETESFYVDWTKGEDHVAYYGGPVESEDEEEETFHYVALNDDGEFEEAEDEETIATILVQAQEAFAAALAANLADIQSSIVALNALDGCEEAVEAQYEGQEDPEIEIGDLYLDVLGEIYTEDQGEFHFGLAYEYGNIAEIEEDDEGEPIYVLEEQLLGEGMTAATLVTLGEKHYLTDYWEGEDTHHQWEFEFTFADPTAEEE